MKWFGASWNAPLCTPETHDERPELPCVRCDRSFDVTDRGVILPGVGENGQLHEAPFHLACFLAALGIVSALESARRRKTH